MQQLDFVQAYPQAPIDYELYIDVPKGCKINDIDNNKEWEMKVLSNIYGQKQADKIWNDYLVTGLKELGFQQSKIDPCILWKGTTIIAIYTDDMIITP
jgi:Reverse transcriptase (RNA-dependent DNA polymerase)